MVMVEYRITESKIGSGFCFFFQAEDGIRDRNVTGVQTCALPIFCCGAPGVCCGAPGVCCGAPGVCLAPGVCGGAPATLTRPLAGPLAGSPNAVRGGPSRAAPPVTIARARSSYSRLGREAPALLVGDQ